MTNLYILCGIYAALLYSFFLYAMHQLFPLVFTIIQNFQKYM